MRNYTTLSLLIFGFFTILSCAKQTAPTGGPKDTIPPVLVNSNPAKGALNVNTKTLELDFSEFIILANAKEQLIITPDIQKKYEINAKKRKVTITLENDLQPNTTYSINFRDAVQDITEKNPVVNLKLAFSTGTYIDSLSIAGSVRDLLQNKEVKDATVALYESDTFNIFQHKPVYITRSNPKGEFLFENLKHGTFFIYAFEDRNRNLIVDSRNENYGFLAEPVTLDRDTTGLVINLVRLDARPLKLTSARPFNTYYNIRTTKGLKDYILQQPSGDTLFTSYGEDRANIRVYNTFQHSDSTLVNFTAIDSLQNTQDTTLYVKFLERKTTPEKFTFSLEQVKTVARTGQISVQARTNKPIALINPDSIYITTDSVTRISIPLQTITFDNKKGRVSINHQLPREIFANAPESNSPTGQKPGNPPPPPQLYLGKSAFLTVESDSTPRFQENLKPLREDETGVLIAEAQTQESHYIIQLLNKSFEVQQSFTNRPKVTFYDLLPGDYMIRLIIDRNQDGEWTPGNFFQRQEPEPVIYYTNEKKLQTINLKANFELGPLLIKY